VSRVDRVPFSQVISHLSSLDRSHTLRVVGMISAPVPGMGRSSGDRQFLYVNGRPCSLPKVSFVDYPITSRVPDGFAQIRRSRKSSTRSTELSTPRKLPSSFSISNSLQVRRVLLSSPFALKLTILFLTQNPATLTSVPTSELSFFTTSRISYKAFA